MTRVLIPRSGACSAKVVSSLDFEKYWTCDIIHNYVKSGFTVAAQCPNILAVDVTTGIARVLGLYVENTTACENVTCLTACATNSIYLTIDRDCCCRPSGWSFSQNTTGIVPTDSMLMSTAVTNGTTVTIVCNSLRETVPITESQSGDQQYPLTTTIGDYCIPCSATATSGGACIFSDTLCNCCNWNVCNIGTDIAFACCRVDFTVSGSGTNLDYIHADPFCEAISHQVYKGKFRFSTIVTGATCNVRLVFAMSSVTTDYDVGTGDWAGICIVASASFCCCPEVTAKITDNGTMTSGPTSSIFCWSPVVCTDYWFKIEWNSNTNTLAASIYTAACCACLVETETITTGDATTADCVRFLHIGSRTGPTNANNLTGWVDCIISENPQNAVNAVDDCVCTTWTSLSENNPNIFIDTGAAQEIPSLAINLNRTLTTETQMQIRMSTTCCCFTDCDTVRTLNISDFTDDTYRFITLPRQCPDARYIQFYGFNDSKVLSINEIKYNTISLAVFEKGHFHKFLGPQSVVANELDSN